MTQDPIVEEVRRLREQYPARFGHDLKAVWADLMAGTQESAAAGRKVVSFPPRCPEPQPPQTKKAGWSDMEGRGQDPIVEEIHRVREHIAEQSSNDLASICRAARERQAASGQAAVSMPSRKSDVDIDLPPKRAAG
jgi:hypothetical protein